jgi:hypothetical protein
MPYLFWTAVGLAAMTMYAPGARVAPAGKVYCTPLANLAPLRSTGVVPGLVSSMNSTGWVLSSGW